MTNRNFVPLQDDQEENKKPILEYNNRTEQSCKKMGLEPSII